MKNMKKETLAGLIAIIAIASVAIFAGCVEEEAPISTPTLTPKSTLSPTPTILTPTPTILTPTPAHSPTPAWQVTVNSAREEDKLTAPMGISGLPTSTYTPKSGYTFLVVDVTFHSIDPDGKLTISSKNVTVISKEGEIISAVGEGSGEGYMVGYVSMNVVSNDLELAYVFTVKKDIINQVFRLQVETLPPISFSIKEG